VFIALKIILTVISFHYNEHNMLVFQLASEKISNDERLLAAIK
jgi:hypothetical protein